jgi:hypothetical protein
MAEMPEIVMPDQRAPTYPAEFRFSSAIERYYLDLPKAVRRNWDLFGGDHAAAVPKPPVVREVEGIPRANINSYEELTAHLGRAFRGLQELDRRLADQVRAAAAAVSKGRTELESVVHRVNAAAGTVPVGTSKGEHILAYLASGLDRVDGIVTDTAKSLGSYG